jgi:ketosteroid isomerase-like protein
MCGVTTSIQMLFGIRPRAACPQQAFTTATRESSDSFREWLGAWSDYRIEPREYIDAGGSVVIVFRQSGIGRGSGVRTERDFFGVYDLSDSKVVRYRQYESRKEAIEAVGLSEQDAPDDS